MNLLAFDLNLLKVLDALLREKSTVLAGARVGLSQPAISSALGRLRNSLKDPLFVRQGQRIVPTDFARSLELPIRHILDELETRLSGPRDFDPAKSVKNFVISGSDFFADMLMPKLAEILSQKAPGMCVQLVNLVPDNYVATLEDNSIDLALIPLSEFPSWIDYEPVFRSPFVMIARKGHPRLRRAGVRPGDTVPIDLFCDLGHVLFSPEGNLKAMGDAALARVGRERRVVMTMPVFSGICNAVAGSELVALLPAQLAEVMVSRGKLSTYVPPMSIDPAQICMVWHKRRTNSAAHRWLRETVHEVLRPLNGAEPSAIS